MDVINYKEIWIKNHIQRKEIKKLLGVEFIKTPSRSSIAKILSEIDYIELEKVFRKWINELIDTDNLQQLAVDGKVMNDKSNEVPALIELIDELDDSFIYTLDAINTKKNSK